MVAHAHTQAPPPSSARHSGASTAPHLTPYDGSSSTDSDSSQSTDSDSPPESPPASSPSDPTDPSPPSSSSEPPSASLPQSKASLKRAEKRKRAKEADATAHIVPDPKSARTPLLDTPSEKDRKLHLEFRKAMTAYSPKISDFSKQKEVSRWTVEIEEAARVHYGPAWQQNPEVVYGAILAFSSELKDMWRDEHKRTPMPLTWARLLEWIKAHVDREIRSESRDALQNLIDGKCHQGKTAVFRYLNNFRRIVAKIPDTSESQLIQYFLSGISAELKPECLTDIKGRPWKSLDALVKHAAAQELKLKARTTPASAPPKQPGTREGKNHLRRTLALAAKKKLKATARKTRTHSDKSEKSDKSLAAVTQDRQEGQRGRAVTASMPLTGDDAAPFRFNRMISEQQAKWLGETQRCWHCYETQAVCKADRADPKFCNLKGNSTPLAKGAHGGAPGFKAK